MINNETHEVKLVHFDATNTIDIIVHVTYNHTSWTGCVVFHNDNDNQKVLVAEMFDNNIIVYDDNKKRIKSVAGFTAWPSTIFAVFLAQELGCLLNDHPLFDITKLFSFKKDYRESAREIAKLITKEFDNTFEIV